MLAALVTAVAWSLPVALAARFVRLDLRAQRLEAERVLAEQARRDALGLEWIELRSEEGVRVVDGDREHAVTRDVTLSTWRGGERVTLRGGIAAVGHGIPLEPLNGIGELQVLARWPARPEGYRDDAGPIVLEPDPERGYRFGRDRAPAAPRGARAYAPFFALAPGLTILALLPYVGWVVALVSVAYVAAELVVLARTRILGAITISLAVMLAERAEERAREAAEVAREREGSWD